MKTLLSFFFLAIIAFAYYLAVDITTPDPRIDSHETRIQSLEEWAQRHGMKY